MNGWEKAPPELYDQGPASSCLGCALGVLLTLILVLALIGLIYIVTP